MQNVTTPLNQVDATPQFALGSWCEDGSGNEYQYVKGIGSCVLGSCLAIAGDYSTALAGVASKGPVGFAMGAIVANNYGWALRKGDGPCVNATAVVPGAQLQLAANGQVDDTATAGTSIVGAYAGTVAGAGAGRVRCTFPVAGVVL